MAEKKQKSTFNTRVYECCAGTDEKLRIAFQCVHFENGYAYATNGKIAIKQTLAFQSVVDPENLDGNSLHRDDYKTIMTFEIAQATDEGIECWNETGQHVFFDYYSPEENEQLPNVENMFKNLKGLTSLSFIGIDPELLMKIKRSLYVPSDCAMRHQFTGVTDGILIDVIGVDEQQAILLPTPLEDTLF